METKLKKHVCPIMCPGIFIRNKVGCVCRMVVVSLYHLMRSFTDQMTIEKTHPTLHDIVDLQARELRLKCSQKENISRGFDVLFLSAEFQTEPHVT